MEDKCHPIRVAEIVAESTKDPEILAAAVLHDVIEDTDATLEEIDELFGSRVKALVVSLTNDPVELKRLGKTEYLTKKLIELPNNALLIKLADRLDNVSDLSIERREWSENYARQTTSILKALALARKLPRDHYVLCETIIEKLDEFTSQL